MTEQNPEGAAPAQEQPEQQTETDWHAEATRLRDELTKARKWEERAKESHAKVQQYEREKLPEAERQIAEAEQRASAAAAQKYGQRLARSEITAAAATAGADIASVFDYLDLSRFVGEDGEVDDKAVSAFVAALPKKAATPPSYDGGSRTTSPAGDMNQLIRQAAGLK